MVQKDHPDIKWFKNGSDKILHSLTGNKVEYSYLKEMAAKAGADDCGVIDIHCPELVEEKQDILSLYPET